LGKEVTERSIVGSILFPLCVSITEKLIPYFDLSNVEKIVSALFGSDDVGPTDILKKLANHSLSDLGFPKVNLYYADKDQMIPEASANGLIAEIRRVCPTITINYIFNQNNGYDHSTLILGARNDDEKLKNLVSLYGTNSWSLISNLMGTRNSRQCRERWKNYLNPSLRTEPWSIEEDHLLVKKYADFGPRWHKISHFFTNRSENNIRNRWQLLLRQWKKRSSNTSNKNRTQKSTCKTKRTFSFRYYFR